MKILVVEDERQLRESIAEMLTKERYVVEQAATYSQASEKCALYGYDCILLDIMLPDGNGFKLLEELKANGKRDSVIIVSARDSIDDKVTGLNLGADDYLAKPFHLAELSARVRSIIRRSTGAASNCVELGNVKVDTALLQVSVGGREVEMSRKEYDILLYFLNRAGHIIRKETLAEAVWGDYIDSADNFDFIYAQVKNVRRKLAAANADVEIKAIYGFGYKMVERCD